MATRNPRVEITTNTRTATVIYSVLPHSSPTHRVWLKIAENKNEGHDSVQMWLPKDQLDDLITALQYARLVAYNNETETGTNS